MNISAWFKHDGQALLQLEQALLAQQLPGLFGYQLLQVGGIGDGLLYQSSRIQHRWLLATPELPSRHAPVLVEAAYLPFASDQVDVILLPHSLDFSPEPEKLLAECERLLIPEGYLIIINFNAWIWNWRAWLPHSPVVIQQCYPLSGRHKHLAQLYELGFILKKQQSHWFYPKTHRPKGFFPFTLCGIEMLLLKKQQATLTPIKPTWKPTQPVRDAMVEPSARKKL